MTGAHGFIGTTLSRQLSLDGYRVFLGDFDITQPALIERFSHQCPEDVVILHLAGIAGRADCERDPVVAHRVNGEGPANVFRAFPKSPHFIQFSSGQVYKDKSTALNESDLIEPKSVYAQSKRAAEIKLQGLAADSNTKLTILRIFNHVHKTQGKNTFMSRIYHDLLDMRPPESSPVLRVGNLDVLRDLGAVQDLTIAVSKMLATSSSDEETEIYNLASGHGKSLRRIVEKLSVRVGVNPELKPDQSLFSAHEAPVYLGDPSRFAKKFGWQPRAIDEDRLIDLFVADLELPQRTRSRLS